MALLAAFTSMRPGTFGVFENDHGVLQKYKMFNLRGVKGSDNTLLTGKKLVSMGYSPNYFNQPIPVTFINGDANDIPIDIDLTNAPTTETPSFPFYVKVQGSNVIYYGLASKVNEFSKPSDFGSYGFTIPATGSASNLPIYETKMTLGSAEVDIQCSYKIVYQITGAYFGICVARLIPGVSADDLDGYMLPIDLTGFENESTVEIRAYILNEDVSAGDNAAISVALGDDAQVVTINY